MPRTHLDDPVVAAPRSFGARHPVAVLALIILTLAVAAYRARRGLSMTDGYAPPLVPAPQGAAVAP